MVVFLAICRLTEVKLYMIEKCVIYFALILLNQIMNLESIKTKFFKLTIE